MRKKKPAIKVVTYGGRIVWYLRTHFSGLTSTLYLELQYLLRKRLFTQYIHFFAEKEKSGVMVLPCLVSIETVNRCNSTCEFCPANRNTETRPFQKMEEQLFYKIIQELKQAEYDGYLNLYVNNEPLIDSRIEDWYLYAREQLPKAKLLLYTNGTLLDLERFKKLASCIDKMIINNYSERLVLHDNLKELYSFVKTNQEYWDMDITIQIRYIREILTNRAGSAPNRGLLKKQNKICIMPFTDLTIYPDGRVGLCCSDALEKTCYGNVGTESLWDIWNSKQYEQLRELIGRNRECYEFCKGCDFVDAGIRNLFMRKKLKGCSKTI